MQKKDYSVTIAKGIAIILMVLGHSGCYKFVNNYIFLFHMPVFFFMSGYCFKSIYLDDVKTFCRKRIKGAYVPYVKWSIVFILLHNILLNANILSDTIPYHGNVQSFYTYRDVLNHTIKAFLMTGTEQLLGGFWFLKSLLWGSFIFVFTRKIIKSPIYGAIVLFASSIILVMFKVKLPGVHIGYIDFFAAFFIMIGHCFRNAKYKGMQLLDYLSSNTFFAIALFCFIGIGSVCWPSTMLNIEWLQVLPYSLTAIAGSILLYSLGSHLSHVHVSHISSLLNKILVFIGNNTLYIFIWHFLSMKITTMLIIVIYGLDIETLGTFPVLEEYSLKGWWLLYLLVGVGLPSLGALFFNKIKKQ